MIAKHSYTSHEIGSSERYGDKELYKEHDSSEYISLYCGRTDDGNQEFHSDRVLDDSLEHAVSVPALDVGRVLDYIQYLDEVLVQE